MDPATQSSAITALAAVAGSIVGGLASFLTTYFTQRHQAHRDLMLREAAHREELYSQFIKEAANVYVDSLDKTLESPASLVGVYSLVGRIRLVSNDTVLAAAEKVADNIIDSYNRPPTTFDDVIKLARESHIDPLKEFTGVPRRAQGYAQAYIAVATHLMKFIRRLVYRKRKLLFEIDPKTFQPALDQTKGQLANRFKGEAQEYLAAKVQELKKKGLINVKPMVKCDDVADEIISIARGTHNSFVAMCTHGRSGISRWA